MVSAVVTLRSDCHLGMVAKAKSHFTTAGLEVHAPFATSFSIGGPASRFEDVFGTKIVIDDSLLGSVTTEGGSLELPVDSQPEEIRDMLESVAFLPPPDFTPGN